MSFSFDTAKAMLAQGFYPDTISSDIHCLCIDGPVFDQVTTLSKFYCLGMPLVVVVRSSTQNAARMLGRASLGNLKVDSEGDVSILRIEEGSFDYKDGTESSIVGDKKIFAEGMVINGKWIDKI